MADSGVNVRITATDKASATINNITKSLSGLGKEANSIQKAFAGFGQAIPAIDQMTAAMGGLSGGMAKVTSGLSSLLSAGGMAGLSIAAVSIAANIDDISESIADWITGLSKVRDEYEKLNPKLEAHLQLVTRLRNQAALAGLAGAARVGVEIEQNEKERARIQKQIDILEARRTSLEARRAQQQAAFAEFERALGRPAGIEELELGPKVDPHIPEQIKEINNEIIGLQQSIRPVIETGKELNKTLGLEEAKEGKKRIEELTKAAEEFQRKVDQIDRALSRQFEQTPGEIPAPPMPEVLPTILTPEQMRDMREKMATGFEYLQIDAFKATQKRIDAETDYFLDSTGKAVRKIDDMRGEALREQKRQYEQMVDSIREGAGRVFDAMLTKGESVFSSLAKFGESVLQTMLRNVFQNAVQALALGSGLGGLFGGGGRGGGAGGLAGGAASSGLGAIFGGLFGGGGAAATATGGMGPMLGATAAGSTTAAGAGGGLLGGLFGGGAAGAVGLGGTIAAGAATAGIATAAILATSFISGLVQGGEKRRAEEKARRAGLIAAGQFAGPETITRYGMAGSGEYSIETDLTGRVRGIGRVPVVNVTVENNMIDAKHAREAGAVIGQEVSRQILAGGSYLADNIAWAAS